MHKWEGSLFKNNHIRLMKCHVWFAVFWLFLPISMLLIIEHRLPLGRSVLATFSSWPALMHGALAHGSYRKIEISRKIPEFIFVIMLLAFPIGTFLSMYVCAPLTDWKDPEQSKPDNPRSGD